MLQAKAIDDEGRALAGTIEDNAGSSTPQKLRSVELNDAASFDENRRVLDGQLCPTSFQWQALHDGGFAHI